MANLIIDVGNTSTAMKFGGQVYHIDGLFEDAAKVALEAFPSAAEVNYVSVVPERDKQWAALCAKHGVKFKQVTNDELRITNGGKKAFLLDYNYPEPETIGADRLCDAEAAFAKYGAPAIVMDFGTALTAAVITNPEPRTPNHGVWQGGVIAPGFPLMRDYLFERTAKLPRMELPASAVAGGKTTACAARSPYQVPKSTMEAMKFGAVVGYRGMVREIVAELKKCYPEVEFKLVATGGFAPVVLKDIGLEFTIDPELTLDGCELICSRM